MSTTQYTPEEVKHKADRLYEQSIHYKVDTPENRGKILAVDVDSGDYEVDAEHLRAGKQLRQRRPDGTFFFYRIGYPSLGKIGGGWRLHTP